MKIMHKVKIIKKKSIKNILNEKNLLSKLHNPFIVNMILTFQDKDNLYLIMDLLLGGDLRYHINKSKLFNEKELKFILACTILGLDYLHQNNILHKDIKPENLVFDSKGYLHITDLGISKIYHEDNAKENSGTLGYMAPEVLFNKNHEFSVDFYALGVIGYELIMGKRPYIGKDKKELRKDIISRQAKIKESNIPQGWSQNAIDFINGLIQRKPEYRLGKKGIMELKENHWFDDLIWDDLLNQKIEAPFRPPVEGNYYHNLGEENDKIGEDTELCYEEIRKREEYSKYFEDYTFNEINLKTNLYTNNNEEKKNIKKYNSLDNDDILVIKKKNEITPKMIFKLKGEIKKFSYNNNNYEFKTKNNYIIKENENINIKNKDKENQRYKKLNVSSMRFNKSYLLYKLNKEENKTKLKIKFNNNSLFQKNDSKLNDQMQLNSLSPYYIPKEKKITKIKFLEKKNNDPILNDIIYHSIYADKAYLFNPKINKKDNHSFRSTNNFINYNIKKFEQYKLPIIKPLQKSISLENYDTVKNIKKPSIMNKRSFKIQKK